MSRMKSHRRAFLRAYGYLPAEVDHKDGDRKNNDPSNLRPATRAENNWNRRGWGKSGEKNVIWDAVSGKWQVKIQAGAVKVYTYASHKVSAIVAARLIRRLLHGSFERSGRATA